MKKHNLYFIITLIVFCTLSLVPAVKAQDTLGITRIDLPLQSISRIRVLLKKDTKHVQFSAQGNTTITTLDGTRTIRHCYIEQETYITPSAAGILIGTMSVPIYAAIIHPATETFTLDKRVYRGALLVIREKNMMLTCINIVELDDYLQGVLPNEITTSWPPEALKAQAVASRTYAIFKELEHKNRDYGLTHTTASQVYKGTQGEDIRTNAAIKSTTGQILTHNGSLFPAYFHSCCGGHTTAAHTAWSVKTHPSLQGTTCSYCTNSPHHNWKHTFSKQEMQAAINKVYPGLTGTSVTPHFPQGETHASFFNIQGSSINTTLSANGLRLSLIHI